MNILKHGKFYNKEKNRLEISKPVKCPECGTIVFAYTYATEEKMPVVCCLCQCEFTVSNDDFLENEND